MTAAGLGRLAALLLLPALARGWDWTTNVESTFDCETHRNPIQLYKEELFKCKGGADNGKECDSDADCTGGKCKKELADFFGVEELDIVTGKYTLVYKFPWAEANAFAFLDKNDDGKGVYAFACVGENPGDTKKYLARFDSTSVTIVKGTNGNTVIGSPYVGAFIKATVGRSFGYAYSEPDSATDAADKDAHPDAAADRAAAADAGSGACPDVHNLDDDDQDADARPDVRADSSAAGAARGARDAVDDLFLRLLRGAHNGADHGDVESNGDGSSDARGNVRTDTRDGGAVLRADDGYVRTVGRADGHGGALGFRT